MDKIEVVVRRKDCMYHMNDLASTINELVKEVNGLKWRLNHSGLERRLDNHISKHKEYAEGGDPCPNENSDI